MTIEPGKLNGRAASPDAASKTGSPNENPQCLQCGMPCPHCKPLRQPPHNIEAEQALLGAILVNNEAHDRVSRFLEAHHFYDPLQPADL